MQTMEETTMAIKTASVYTLADVVRFLNDEASGFGDSISPGFGHRYRGASEALENRNDPTLANEILAEEESYITARINDLQRRLVRIRGYRDALEVLKP